MSNDLDIFRNGIRRFRIGGIAVAALPLVLGVALILAGRESALMMIIISLILLFLVFWATLCAEEVVSKLQAVSQDRR